jgi:large subunit ribosomal protein L23
MKGSKRNLKDPFNIIMHPWVTEKTLWKMGDPKAGKDEDRGENKLDFVVNRRATKADVKWAIETLYNYKVESVNIRIMKEGKHAIVKFAEGYSAEELGNNIGIF